MSFTPGPWTIDADDRICAAGEPILWGWDDGSIVGSEDDLSLIAAAPELLEAALLAVSVLGNMAITLGTTPEEGTVVPQLRAAIAKATGEGK